MAVRFRRIAEGEIEPTRITLRVMPGENGTPIGRVSTLAYGEDGGVEMMTTESADPPIETALKLAVELAAFKDEDVDVVDPHRLWQPAWGTLD